MAFMDILLRRFPETFVWYSFRKPTSTNPYSIPYAFSSRNTNPLQPLWLRHFLNLGPGAWFKGLQAAQFGRAQNAQVVLADMAFEAVVAGRVAARALGLPLLVSIHDDPVNRVRVKGGPAWLGDWYEREFAKTLHASRGVGVISDYMGEIYQKRYGVKTVTLYPGVDETACLPQKKLDPRQPVVTIGSVGSVNDAANWNILLDAIRMLNEEGGGRTFRLLHIGRLPETLRTSQDVESTGWIPEDEFLRQLARVDMGFLNWSFDPRHAETGRTSLPLKIHSYIQAQVSMLALGAADSTVIRFVQDYHCGAVCTIPAAETLAECIRDFSLSQARWADALVNVARLKQVFSRDNFYKTFENFINIPGRGTANPK
jgi:hypothetical protein